MVIVQSHPWVSLALVGATPRLRVLAQWNSPAMPNVVNTSAISTPWPVRSV